MISRAALVLEIVVIVEVEVVVLVVVTLTEKRLQLTNYSVDYIESSISFKMQALFYIMTSNGSVLGKKITSLF